MKAGSNLRCKIAKEAATLLYSGAEKEYKQAKLKAARNIGTHFLPTNLEVALELDKIAEAHEGAARKERLIRMRKEALKIMKTLKQYRPLLFGSVWRGTIRQGSDIDISVYYEVANEIPNLLEKNCVKISRCEWTRLTKKGKTEAAFHIHGETSRNQQIEVVVRSPDEADIRRKCEVFGDELKGLNVRELERLLEENPTRKFIPE